MKVELEEAAETARVEEEERLKVAAQTKALVSLVRAPLPPVILRPHY